jgi:beta-lactamase class A
MKSLVLLVCLAVTSSLAQKAPHTEALKLSISTDMQKIVNETIEETLREFADRGLEAGKIAVTLVDMQNPPWLKVADFRGDQPIYPASVVKLFYLVAVHQWLRDGKLKETSELRRAMRDMIVDSSNDATHFIVDVLTDATGGSELPPRALRRWAYKREAVNRYFISRGYENINIVQKTYCEDIYGRERQFWNEGKNRNMLTTNATARLFAEIVLGKAVSPDASRQMMELLKRNPHKEDKDPDSQDTGFTGIALRNKPNAKLWSKAGLTSNSRHDAAYVELEDGLKFILVVFTENVARERMIIPTIAEKIIQKFKNL